MEKKWNEDKIKFYKYYFRGVEKPVVMQAYNREEADSMLNLLPEKSGVEINMEFLEDVKIEMPITGISKLVRFGKDYIWVGTDKTADGWMLESEFKKITNAEKN
jgi:hypothetical protein